MAVRELYHENGKEKNIRAEIKKPYAQLWYMYGKFVSYSLEIEGKQERPEKVIIQSPDEEFLDNCQAQPKPQLD